MGWIWRRSFGTGLLAAVVLTARLAAQHEHMPGMSPAGEMPPGPLGIPHTRMGSGSAWLPDAAPMRAWHWMPGQWMLMLHGDVDLIFNRQFSERGASQLSSTNWLMFMAMRSLQRGNALLHLHAMASAEPLTIGGRGYPLLLQSGETWQGEPLHDRQHPHDLFVELAAIYEQRVARGLAVSLYGAPVGEPALGPVAFMHRPSGQSDPLASIAHHWQDATHVTFGVLTAGLYTRLAKLEGSWFNGREPDEDRYGIDVRAPDSWSARLTVNPAREWSANASYGFLKSPDPDHPDEAERRFGASLLHTRRLGENGEWSAALIWGASRHERTSHSLVAETNLQLNGRNNFFGRVTWVQKSAEDLQVPGVPAGSRYDITSVSAGYVRELGAWQGATLGLGVRGSVNRVPPGLEPSYGTRMPMGIAVYLRLRPAAVH
jgi:hypothetical protein